MLEHRNISYSVFKNILENIMWYKENSKSVSINMLVTKYNLNNWNYSLFDDLGLDFNYKISTPSEIFTQSKFKLNESDKIKLYKLIIKVYERYNYKIKCETDLITKRALFSNLPKILDSILIIELYCEQNHYYVFNKSFKKFKAADEYAKCIKSSLIKFLKKI